MGARLQDPGLRVPELRARILELHAKGLHLAEIARQVHRDPTTVAYHLRHAQRRERRLRCIQAVEGVRR